MFKDSGFTAIRTVEFMSFDFPRAHTNGLLEMPTTMQAFPQPPWNYAKNLAKRLAVGNFVRYAFHGRSRDWVTLADRLVKRVLTSGGVFHLWGHSWELQRTNQWDRLQDVLRLLGELKTQAPCLTNGQIVQEALAVPAQHVGVRPTRAAVLL